LLKNPRYAAPAAALSACSAEALVGRLACDNDVVRSVDELTRNSTRLVRACISSPVFNFTVCKRLARQSTLAAATVAFLAWCY
jgi:hypothetical protein